MALQSFVDPEGRTWRVWDVVPGSQTGFDRTRRHLPDEMASGWLCFECESASEKRRFFPIPPAWTTCGDRELWVLCRSAIAMRRPAAAPATVS